MAYSYQSNLCWYFQCIFHSKKYVQIKWCISWTDPFVCNLTSKSNFSNEIHFKPGRKRCITSQFCYKQYLNHFKIIHRIFPWINRNCSKLLQLIDKYKVLRLTADMNKLSSSYLLICNFFSITIQRS